MDRRRLFDATLLVFVLATLVAFSVHRIIAVDVWWQLATGELILESGWPRVDPFSYGEPGREWIEMRWLFCVAAFLVFKYLSLNFLIVIKTALLLGIGALLLRMRRQGPLWIAAAGIELFCFMAHLRFLVRPEILSFVFLAVFLERLDARTTALSRRSIALIVGLQLLWVNSHSTFLIGPATLWIFAIAEGARQFLVVRSHARVFKEVRDLLTVAVGATLACLVNPYLLDGFLFPIRLLLQIQGDHPLNQIIQEFASPFSRGLGWINTQKLLIGGAIAAATFGLRRDRTQIAWGAVWLAYVVLAAMAQRNVALLGLVSAFVLVRNLRHAVERCGVWLPATCRTATGLFVLLLLPAVATDAHPIRLDRWERFGFGASTYHFPFQAMDFVYREGLPRPVIGKLGEGGAFMLLGGPRSTYVDGRLEVYSGEFLDRYRRTFGSRTLWDAETGRHGVQTAVLNHQGAGVTVVMLENHPDWVPVYLDSRFVVFVKDPTGVNPRVAELRFDWNRVEPAPPRPLQMLRSRDWLAGWPFRRPDPVPPANLGRLFLSLGKLERSRGYYREALERAPGIAQTRVILGLIERAMGDEATAAALLESAPGRLIRSPEMLKLQAELYEVQGQPQAALDSYVEALVAGGDESDAVLRLSVLAAQTDRAVAALQQAADAGDGGAGLRTALGLLYMKQGDVRRGESLLRASLAMEPRQPRILNQLAILAGRAGDVEEAKRLLRRAIELDPDFTDPRDNLRRLEAGGR